MGKPPSCGVSCTHVEFNNSPLTTVAMGIYFPTPRLPPAPYHLPTKLPLAFQTPLLPEGPRQKNHMYSSWEASQPDASGRQKEGVCGCVGCGHEQGGGCSSWYQQVARGAIKGIKREREQSPLIISSDSNKNKASVLSHSLGPELFPTVLPRWPGALFLHSAETQHNSTDELIFMLLFLKPKAGGIC